jgi:hypothetical protein
MRGASVRAIQELAGHKDLSTTQAYMHLSPAALEDAIRLLDGSTPVRFRGGIVEAAGIEPYPGDFDKWRRCPTFVVNSGLGNESTRNSLSLQSPGVLLSLGETVESGGTGVPTSASTSPPERKVHVFSLPRVSPMISFPGKVRSRGHCPLNVVRARGGPGGPSAGRLRRCLRGRSGDSDRSAWTRFLDFTPKKPR